jgi:hypothetical protein
MEKHGEDVQSNQTTLDETHDRRRGVERTTESIKDCGLGRTHAEAAFTHEHEYSSRCGFVSSSPSPTMNVETIPGSTVITVCELFYDTLVTRIGGEFSFRETDPDGSLGTIRLYDSVW